MGDLLGDLTGGLRQLDINLTAEELCDALWLAAQDWADFPAAFSAVGPTERADQAGAGVRHREHHPVGHPQAGGMARIEPRDSARPPGDADADVPSLPSMSLTLPDAPALPQARQLAAILRPLRYDPRRTSPEATIDEEATALDTAQAGSRRLVWRTTRRRRLDIDIVFDIGGSGPLWTRLANELNAMLETVGVFRSARFWLLNSDVDGVPLLPAAAGSVPSRRIAVPYGVVCEAPRRPLVVVLTDGTGKAWQSGDAHEPLRAWAARGTVLAVQLLPPHMWNRTALRALPVGFRPATEHPHSGARIEIDDARLSIAGLDRASLPAATAIPVIALDARWVRSWLPLTLGGQAGTVRGYAALLPPPAHHAPRAAEAEPPLTPEECYDQFMLMASRDARRLARLLAVTTPTLPAMRKIRHQILPGSRPEILAEVLLGGLMTWPSVTPAEAMAGLLQVEFKLGVQDLLRERAGGETELKSDTLLVATALQARYGAGRTYEAVAVGPGLPRPLVTVPLPPARAETRLVAPYPSPRDVIVVRRVRASADSAAPGDGEDPVERGMQSIQIGIWGSSASGRSTYLAVLAMPDESGWSDETGWTDWRRGEQWRVVPADAATREFVRIRIDRFQKARDFPEATMRHRPEPLSFRLERRKARSPLHWFSKEPVAEISLTLTDKAGLDFLDSGEVAGLADSDVLLYFYDPGYDSEPNKHHSADFFNKAAIEIARLTLEQDRLDQGFPPQQLAVCVPKLDNQLVFDKAIHYGCLRTDKRAGLPWIPPPLAKRLFESLTYEEHSIAAHQLRETISHSFHPDRTSFHAFSSIGFWAGQDGRLFDPGDVCNAVEVFDSGIRTRPALRGTIRPVHVIDPLVTLVERHARQAGRP